MRRTATRPIPSGRVSPGAALRFGIGLAVASLVLMTVTINLLAALLAFTGFVGYVGVYTIWLKRRSPHNIVIGGAAGAMPPLVAWAATRGSLSWTAVYLFAIVFYWTPPHFWALSLLMKKEYAEVGVPMLPVVRGERETRRQILLYTLLLYAVTQLPFCAGEFGGIYLVGSIAARPGVRRRRGDAGPVGQPQGGVAAVSLLDAVPGLTVRGDGRRRQVLRRARRRKSLCIAAQRCSMPLKPAYPSNFFKPLPNRADAISQQVPLGAERMYTHGGV